MADEGGFGKSPGIDVDVSAMGWLTPFTEAGGARICSLCPDVIYVIV